MGARKVTWTKVRVVGGPAGRPIFVPNPNVKRGFSIVKPVWKVPEPLDQVIRCSNQAYRLVYEGTTPFYVASNEPAACRRLRAIFTPSLG